MIQQYIQELVDHAHRTAEHLLIRQDGEFYPFGAYINNQGELIPLGLHGGDEFPLSDTKIDEYRKHFESELRKNNIKAYAITYDCYVKRNGTQDKSDAIAIECFSMIDSQKIIYYFPYQRLSSEELEFGDSWGQTMEMR